MTTTITQLEMFSDQTHHIATFSVEESGWVVSWLPSRVLNYNMAVTAMQLAEAVARVKDGQDNRMWIFLSDWAAELHLDLDDAIALVEAS